MVADGFRLGFCLIAAFNMVTKSGWCVFFFKLLKKEKNLCFGSYLCKAGSRYVQRGQRGNLRPQSRTVLSRLTKRRGLLACLRRARAVPKHARAAVRLPRQPDVDQLNKTSLQTFLARTAQQRTATSPPVTAAGWEQPSLCTAKMGFPVNSQTASSEEKHPEKAEKQLHTGITSSRTTSPRTHVHKNGEKQRKKFHGAQRAPKTFFGLNQAQKPIYRPKSPEMSGSMYKWCFQGSSMCPIFFENIHSGGKKNQWIVAHLQN